MTRAGSFDDGMVVSDLGSGLGVVKRVGGCSRRGCGKTVVWDRYRNSE